MTNRTGLVWTQNIPIKLWLSSTGRFEGKEGRNGGGRECRGEGGREEKSRVE